MPLTKSPAIHRSLTDLFGPTPPAHWRSPASRWQTIGRSRNPGRIGRGDRAARASAMARRGTRWVPPQITSSTVSSHLAHVREKLGVRTTGEVMQYAYRAGLVGSRASALD